MVQLAVPYFRPENASSTLGHFLCFAGEKSARLKCTYTYSCGKGWERECHEVPGPHRHGRARQEWSLYHRGSQGDSCCYFIVGCPLRGHRWWVEVKHFYHVFPEHPKERSVPAQNHSSRSQRVKCQVLYSSGHCKPEIMVTCMCYQSHFISKLYFSSIKFYLFLGLFFFCFLFMTLIPKNFLVTSS